MLLPACASEQGNEIGLVSVYIYIYVCVYKKKDVIERSRDVLGMVRTWFHENLALKNDR